MIILTERQIKLAEQLLISVLKREPNVSYSELAERITPPMHHRQVGYDIGQISKLCHQLGLPLLSAKVVNKNSHTVGDGFFGLCEELGIDIGSLSEKDLCKKELAKIRESKRWYVLVDYLGLNLNFERPYCEIYPDEIPSNDTAVIHEGAVKQVLVNQYERNPQARSLCIMKHGCRCSVCGLDFEEYYGEVGKDFIHVHHIVPLHQIKRDYIVDGEKDLIPVCPNCHAMLHRKIDGQYISIEDLKLHIKKKQWTQ